MDLNLKDHVVVVTGGGRGIGEATARAFAGEGAHVAIWDLDERAGKAAEEIQRSFPVRSIGISADVVYEREVCTATKRTIELLGPIDHLVHAAAIGSGKFGFPFSKLQPQDWARVLEVNVMGMVQVAHAVAAQMVEQGSGTMVFLSSVAGQIGSQTDPPYSASKAANINFAQCLAKDLARKGIRVNTVCPGMVQTPLNRSVWKAWHDQTPSAERLSYDEWADRKIQALVPLGKWQTPDAIADMIVFLSSARSAHVTGQTINVDGGFVMHW